VTTHLLELVETRELLRLEVASTVADDAEAAEALEWLDVLDRARELVKAGAW